MVVDALNAVDPRHGWYFWTGNGKPVTAVAHWQTALQSLFELAHVDGAHSHRFRDSFAVSLLEKGVSIETVSMLLGLRHPYHAPALSPAGEIVAGSSGSGSSEGVGC